MDIGHLPVNPDSIEIGPRPHTERLTVKPVIIRHRAVRIKHLGMFLLQDVYEIVGC